MKIGDTMTYTDQRGTRTGVVLNILPAKMMDVSTGVEFEGQKFYFWDEKRRRGFWSCAMCSVEPTSRPGGEK